MSSVMTRPSFSTTLNRVFYQSSFYRCDELLVFQEHPRFNDILRLSGMMPPRSTYSECVS
eukprot:scaffold4979_cov73-Cylindrotheca_fusiformis.AAC.7